MIKICKTDDGYDVLAPNGAVIGHTRMSDQAWSYAPWIIDGVNETLRGGVNNTQKRRKGWPTRAAAVREIAIMNSAAICAAN